MFVNSVKNIFKTLIHYNMFKTSGKTQKRFDKCLSKMFSSFIRQTLMINVWINYKNFIIFTIFWDIQKMLVCEHLLLCYIFHVYKKKINYHAGNFSNTYSTVIHVSFFLRRLT